MLVCHTGEESEGSIADPPSYEGWTVVQGAGLVDEVNHCGVWGWTNMWRWTGKVEKRAEGLPCPSSAQNHASGPRAGVVLAAAKWSLSIAAVSHGPIQPQSRYGPPVFHAGVGFAHSREPFQATASHRRLEDSPKQYPPCSRSASQRIHLATLARPLRLNILPKTSSSGRTNKLRRPRHMQDSSPMLIAPANLLPHDRRRWLNTPLY